MKVSLLAGFMAALIGAQSAPPRKDIPAIAKAANGAIVSIVMSDKDGHAIAQGTGFLISKDGRIVTNYHVIENGSSAIVKLPDGAFFVVDGVLAFDKARDVAVIKAHGENFRTLTLGNSDRLQVGEEVVAIGNPLSLESTVSNGIVSGIRTAEKEGGKFLQVTTPISPGSSGGPLFNMAGEVVGITTLYLEGGENLNFAIPINDVKPLLKTHYSELFDFPDEKPDESEKGKAHQETARQYYDEIYRAGGLSETYVCFSDEADSADLFTFSAYAYDETYSKAFDKEVEFTGRIHMDKVNNRTQNPENVEGFNKATKTQEEIQKSMPYVGFMLDHELHHGWPDEEFFLHGGRALVANFYHKGVKSESVEYRWDGRNSWIYQVQSSHEKIIYSLSIEPTTLHYIEQITVMISGFDGLPSTGLPLAGDCEKIPRKDQ